MAVPTLFSKGVPDADGLKAACSAIVAPPEEADIRLSMNPGTGSDTDADAGSEWYCR